MPFDELCFFLLNKYQLAPHLCRELKAREGTCLTKKLTRYMDLPDAPHVVHF